MKLHRRFFRYGALALSAILPCLGFGQEAADESARRDADAPDAPRESRDPGRNPAPEDELGGRDLNPERRIQIMRQRIERLREDAETRRGEEEWAPRNRPDRPRHAEQMRQLEHVLAALENLRRAGLDDHTESLERVARELRAQMRQSGMPEGERLRDARRYEWNVDAGRGPAAGMEHRMMEMQRHLMSMQEQMEQMGRAMREMQERMQRMQGEREGEGRGGE